MMYIYGVNADTLDAGLVVLPSIPERAFLSKLSTSEAKALSLKTSFPKRSIHIQLLGMKLREKVGQRIRIRYRSSGNCHFKLTNFKDTMDPMCSINDGIGDTEHYFLLCHL